MAAVRAGGSLEPIREGRQAGADFLRSRVKPAVRRGIGHVEPIDRLVTRRGDLRRRGERLRDMYEALRDAYRTGSPAPPGELPRIADIEAVEVAALKGEHVFRTFFENLCVEGEVEVASILLTRRLIAAKDKGMARSIAQVMQHYEELRPIADVCLAICALGEPMPETAWTLFQRNDPNLVLRHAAGEYFTFGFRWYPEDASTTLARALVDEVVVKADIITWLDIALTAFGAGYPELSAGALDRAEAKLAEVQDTNLTKRLRARIATLREWHDLAVRAAEPATAPVGEIPFALVDYKHPDRRRASADLGDAVQTLATLGHLTRRQQLRFTGEPALTAVAEQLSGEIPPARRAADAQPTVRLYTLNRGASRYTQLPNGTWTIISGWFANPLGAGHWDIPLNANLRPIFVSFQIGIAALAAPGAVDYLRRYEPIGCLDWDTVFLLQAAGVSAFFSGAIESTLDTLIAPTTHAAKGQTLVVDGPARATGHRRSWRSEATRDGALGNNLSVALRTLSEYRDRAAKITTADLHCYVAARAIGCPVDFRPTDVGPAEVGDHANLSDADFDKMRIGIADKLSTVIGAIVSGRPDDEVYQAWRDVCAADVAEAEAALHSAPGHPTLSFDINEACDVIRSGAVNVERSEPTGDGIEINIEFSLDGNYKHQFDVVLDSVVANTSRPVRAFVLSRDHGPDDHARMARLFPTVSFRWLPTDNINYGRITGLNRWVTPATMDRTVLPVLLPKVHRIIHFDLDTLALTDVGELFDMDMRGAAIAAATEPQPRYLSGYAMLRRSAARLRREGRPDLSRELTVRTHSRLPFDFDIFNVGIMVMDLDRMRADDFCGTYLPYVQAYGINGQNVVNVYAGAERVDISPDWNRLIRLEIAPNPKIAHWAGPHKPWGAHWYVNAREIWREGERRFEHRAKRVGVMS
jgi:lipopolysaccharide biosynthesis glycosyltransferase